MSTDWADLGRVLALAPAIGLAGLVATVWVHGGESPMQHPVLNHGIDDQNPEQYVQAVSRVMAMPEADLLSLVPDKPITAFCECPACYGGVEGNHIFNWSIDRPGEMTCKHCGTVFPNTTYPEDRILAGKNRLGETVEFTYHYNEERTISHFLSGNLRRWQRAWLMSQIVVLGKAYHVTRDEAYARRVVLVLDRLAEVFPHYPIMRNGVRTFGFLPSQEFPFAWDSGAWGFFHNEIPKGVINAYDLVYASPEFERLSQQRGRDVRRALEDDLLRVTFEAAAAQNHHMSNIIGYDVAGAALMGRVIHEPRYVHWAFRWMKKTATEGFFYDGFWHEAPSYHYMTLGGLSSAFDCVMGYSDPPGYTDEVDGTRFDDLQPQRDFPFFARLMHAPSVLDLPNGCSTAVHDTHPYEKRSKPRDTTTTTIAPGFGHASLGRGFGSHQLQAQLHFSGSHGHAHYDSLNLTLWGKQREMLPDLGYTWTQMRTWCTSTVGHNTVVVDRQDQRGNPSDGNLLWFFPDTNGVAVVEADGVRAYGNVPGVGQYRRLLLMVPVSATDAYVVDIFRVRGGAMHDWVMHGDADRDMTAACSLPLSGLRETMLEPGEQWVEPTIEGARYNPYGMLHEMKRGLAEGGFRIDFSYLDEPSPGLRVHMMPDGPAEVWLGRSPSVRRMGQGAAGDMRKAYDFWMPQVLVRRQAETPCESVFAAVHEPYAGSPFIEAVAPLPLSPPDRHAVAMRVTCGTTVDTIISTLDGSGAPPRVTPDGVRIKGGLGIVRHVAGRVTAAWLFGGAELATGKCALRLDTPGHSGQLTASTRKADGAAEDSLTSAVALPLGRTLHGTWLIVTHGNGFSHGYEIERVEKGEGAAATIVLTADHGLRIAADHTDEVFFPKRRMTGPNTFVIPGMASFRDTGSEQVEP